MFNDENLRLFFFIVGASHFHNTQSQNRRQTLVADMQNLRRLDQLTSSAQSLQAMLPLATSVNSTSYPHLEQFLIKTPSTSALSSLRKDPTTYASLCRLNNLSSQGNLSHVKSNNDQDDMTNKSSDELKEQNRIGEKNLYEKSTPVEIRVRCIFLRVGEIDTLNERYTSEIFFEASWYIKDPRIVTESDSQPGNFNPQLVVLNHMGDSLRHDVSLVFINYISTRIS